MLRVRDILVMVTQEALHVSLA